MIYNELLSARQHLDKNIKALEQELSALPMGNIYCVHDKNRLKWFFNNGHGAKYIKKNQQELIKKLSNRKYLSLLLRDYVQERDAIDAYLSLHNVNIGKDAQKLLAQPDYQQFLSPTFKTISQELQDWMQESYEKCPYHPEHLTYLTQSGNTVRSKSEAMIDMLLHMYKIPFRYECALFFKDCTIYPDFTIRHPKTGDTYYWEHLGLMDDPAYCKKALTKIQFYICQGIMPGTQLITTFESGQVPFSSETVSSLIEHHFLN